MHVDVGKRNVAHVVEPCEHHAGNPQRDDVPRRDQHVAGVEVVENFVPTRTRLT